jgi:GMP synthase (glutamine-hydrolysing)
LIGLAQHKETIIVLDFGAQYSRLIARRVRECNVFCEILPYDTRLEQIVQKDPKGIIFTGGPASVYAEDAPMCDPRLYDATIPILGICYGMQLTALMQGGVVRRADRREYGKSMMDVVDRSDLFGGVQTVTQCWMSHGDSVSAPPKGFKILASTPNSPVAAMGDPVRRIYGVQFHPEVVHTTEGTKILKNFLYGICGCRGAWNMGSFIESATGAIRERIGVSSAICGLSGGVDSSVAAVLTHRAIGDRLTSIFVDHGLLRKGEADQVVKTFRDSLGMKLVHVEASERFLTRLEGVIDPEQKRKIIGDEFIRVFEDEAAKVGGEFLVQGTLYPDVIESGTRTAAVIKTHHNVGGLPADMRLKLVEPLRDLFKDEVRAVGRSIGLPDEVVGRHPFPGPGLAIRITGDVTKERLDALREADAIVIEEVRNAGLYNDLWQVFAVLLPVRSVGVMGDERTYANAIAVRAVTSEDAMTADWARLPYELLERLAGRIVNEVKGVNRVVYDITSKPPATIEWE